MRSGRCSSVRLWAEQLMATPMWRPAFIHSPHWCRAMLNTSPVMGWMRLERSARGTNLSGPMKPRWGWIQRTSDSTPTMWPRARSILGW